MALISFAVTAQLISALVFAYAKPLVNAYAKTGSHDEAHMLHLKQCSQRRLKSAKAKVFPGLSNKNFGLKAYMWTLPDHQGDSLKWALKFLKKHTTFYNFRKSPWNEFLILLYNLYILKNLPEMKEKLPWFPFYTYHMYHVSLVMRKPAFCICENKDADQLRGNCEADQRLCFSYTDSTIPLLPKTEISSL